MSDTYESELQLLNRLSELGTQELRIDLCKFLRLVNICSWMIIIFMWTPTVFIHTSYGRLMISVHETQPCSDNSYHCAGAVLRSDFQQSRKPLLNNSLCLLKQTSNHYCSWEYFLDVAYTRSSIHDHTRHITLGCRVGRDR